MISLDTEDSGIDFKHGSAAPFFVTICLENGEQTYWQFEVDPLTRKVEAPKEDIEAIEAVIQGADELVLQNAKFDAQALAVLGIRDWPWVKTRDTLYAGHLLASNAPHDLTSMSLQYLNVNIKPLEDKLEKAVKEARSLVRRKYPDWRIARKGLPEMPSAKGTVWRMDYWLPRAMAKTEDYEPDHPWWTVLSDYGNADSAVTLPLFKRQKQLIEERGLWNIYLERLKLLPIVYDMESRGVTINRSRLEELWNEYREESERAGRLCTNLAKTYDYDLELPKSGNNKSLTRFIFGTAKTICKSCGFEEEVDISIPLIVQKELSCPKCFKSLIYLETPYLGLPSVKVSKKTGEPSLDKNVIEHYEATLPERSKPLTFIRALRSMRKRDTALGFADAYERFGLPLREDQKLAMLFNKNGKGALFTDWLNLYSSLNATGTSTLRFSMNNPNSQQVSKQEEAGLRSLFGPAPGREWWIRDAQNIELRLPAFEAEEDEMVALFDRPDDPPYYGSYHMLIFDTLHPEKFEKYGKKCKEVYESTWYQWTKNGNFAVQYGAVEQSGTADRAYHVPGAQRRIEDRFKKIKQLNNRMISNAEKYGYVETIPDKTVDSKRGYPLLCTRSKWGGILPTVPLSYHVQGSAMWWMSKSMTRCYDYLKKLRQKTKIDAYIALQIHDELIFDFPKGKGDEPWKTHLPYVRELGRLMEMGGDDYGIPTPTSCKYHAVNWSEGVSV